MKNIFWLFMLALLTTVSCKKDDKCTIEGDLDVVIIGRWDVKTFGFIVGEVEFLADGTLIDADGVLINVEIGGVVLDEKSYMVISNSIILVRAENGGQSQESEIDVISYTCEEIKTTAFGFPVTLERK